MLSFNKKDYETKNRIYTEIYKEIKDYLEIKYFKNNPNEDKDKIIRKCVSNFDIFNKINYYIKIINSINITNEQIVHISNTLIEELQHILIDFYDNY